VTIVTSLPSQQELSARETAVSAKPLVESVAPPASVQIGQVPSTPVSAEPALDLSIPGVPSPAPPPAPPQGTNEQGRPSVYGSGVTVPEQIDPRAVQVARLKCEAEIEQLCPNAGEGPARARCLEQRAKDLAPLCRPQLRERFVKWKENRSRVTAACEADIKRLCAVVKPGDGRIRQCLQEHAQEVSDRCYQTLPKGTLLFRQ
jgi:hypothetical protein